MSTALFTETALAALASGLLGSLHCAAMCGPLVLAGCSAERGEGSVSPRAAAGYFAGRLVSYAMIGSVMGHLGQHAMCILPVSAVQGVAIAIVAVVAIARGVAILRGRRRDPSLVELKRGPGRGYARGSSLLTSVAALLPKRGLGLGLATGFLPCGMLLPAFALAASTSSAPLGAATMAIFAVASAPGLFAPLLGRGVIRRISAAIPERAFGALWIALAAYVMIRPLLAAAHHHAH